MTTRTIDMTRRTWGHNWDVKTAEDGLLRGFCWLTPAPRVGDLVTWRTQYGLATGAFVESRWVGNVDDMYEVAVRVVARHAPKQTHHLGTTKAPPAA
jgi:hypothetical protein